MKFSFKRVWQILLVLILFTLIYNSKSEHYKNKVDFYNKNIDGIITKIKRTRGTKVYYAESDFFYLEQLEDKLLKVGDSISKKTNSELAVYEKIENEHYIYLTKIKVMKPQSSYFKFFFGL